MLPTRRAAAVALDLAPPFQALLHYQPAAGEALPVEWQRTAMTAIMMTHPQEKAQAMHCCCRTTARRRAQLLRPHLQQRQAVLRHEVLAMEGGAVAQKFERCQPHPLHPLGQGQATPG